MQLSAKVSKATNCGFLFLGLSFFAIGIAEVIVRTLAPQGVAVSWQDEFDGIRISRSNVQGRHSILDKFDVEVTTNDRRFRGSKTTDTTLSSDTLRVATLGDSFTFGWGADDEKTYPAILERLIQQSHWVQSNAKVEVLNAGNGGTGTGEQALLYDLYVKKFSPKVVILGVNPGDIDDDAERKSFELRSDGRVYPRPRQQDHAADSPVRLVRKVVNSLPGYGFIVQHSQLVALLRNRLLNLLAETQKPAFANDSAEKKLDSSATFQNALQLLTAEILWLKSRLEETNGQLVVVFLPTRDLIDTRLASEQPFAQTKAVAMAESLQQTCGQNGIPFADLTEPFRKRWSQKPDLYFGGLDAHPTPAGYEAIAQGVNALLESSGMLAR